MQGLSGAGAIGRQWCLRNLAVMVQAVQAPEEYSALAGGQRAPAGGKRGGAGGAHLGSDGAGAGGVERFRQTISHPCDLQVTCMCVVRGQGGAVEDLGEVCRVNAELMVGCTRGKPAQQLQHTLSSCTDGSCRASTCVPAGRNLLGSCACNKAALH